MKNIFKKDYINSLLQIVARKVKKVLWSVGKSAFLWILILIMADLMFSEYLFYRYVISAKTKPEEITVGLIFNKNTYQLVLQKQQERENIINKSLAEKLIDPFY